MLAQQVEINEVTGIKVKQTNNGFELVLETANSDKLQPASRSEGNVFIVEIPNAQLKLTDENAFRQGKPTAGIAEIEVVNSSENSIKIAIKGEASLPKVELDDSDIGLIFVVTPVATSAQQPETPTVNQSENTTPQAEESPIELTVTGTRFEVPIQDTPQSIQVIPRQVLEDRGTVRLDEFTDNVSGVQRLTEGTGPGSSGFIIRGFSDEYETLRNGFRSQGGFARDLANIDRIEVLKGPAAILYGSGFQSGTVNTITKKPLEEPRYEVKATVGSYDLYRGELDLTGKLTESGSLLYRLNASYQNQGSFRDFGRYSGTFIAPALTWKLSDRTTLNIDYENLTYELVDPGVFRADPRFLRIRRSFFQGEPDINFETYTANSLTYEFEHRFSDNWQFKQTFNGLWQQSTTTNSHPD